MLSAHATLWPHFFLTALPMLPNEHNDQQMNSASMYHITNIRVKIVSALDCFFQTVLCKNGAALNPLTLV